MAFDEHTNLALSTVATAPSPPTTGTTLTVDDPTYFPDPASVGAYNCTIWPTSTAPDQGNAEIVRVTAKSGSTLTVTRAQESTTARSVVSGDQIAITITKKVIDDIEAALPATKGDLATFSTLNAVLGVGANDSVLQAASGETTGLIWRTEPRLSSIANASGVQRLNFGLTDAAVVIPLPAGSAAFQRFFRTTGLWDPGSAQNNLVLELQDMGGGIQLYDTMTGLQMRSIVAEGAVGVGAFSSGHAATVAEYENIRITMQLTNVRTGSTITYTDSWGLRIRYNQLAFGTLNCTTIRGIELRSPFAGNITNYFGLHIFDVSQPSGNNYLVEVGTIRGTSGTGETSAPTYFRIVGNKSDVDRETAVYIGEGSGSGWNLRQLKTKAGDTLGAADRVVVAV